MVRKHDHGLYGEGAVAADMPNRVPQEGDALGIVEKGRSSMGHDGEEIGRTGDICAAIADLFGSGSVRVKER
jgi:hypothetical protein